MLHVIFNYHAFIFIYHSFSPKRNSFICWICVCSSKPSLHTSSKSILCIYCTLSWIRKHSHWDRDGSDSVKYRRSKDALLMEMCNYSCCIFQVPLNVALAALQFLEYEVQNYIYLSKRLETYCKYNGGLAISTLK